MYIRIALHFPVLLVSPFVSLHVLHSPFTFFSFMFLHFHYIPQLLSLLLSYVLHFIHLFHSIFHLFCPRFIFLSFSLCPLFLHSTVSRRNYSRTSGLSILYWSEQRLPGFPEQPTCSQSSIELHGETIDSRSFQKLFQVSSLTWTNNRDVITFNASPGLVGLRYIPDYRETCKASWLGEQCGVFLTLDSTRGCELRVFAI